MTRLALLVAAVALVASAARAGAQPLEAGGRVLVVPFDGGSDPRGSWLGEGVAILLTDDLNDHGADAIARDERVRAFERLHVPPLVTLAQGTIVKVGQLVGATTIITGRLQLTGETLAVHAQALRIDSGRIVAKMDEQGSLEDLLEIVERLARQLVPETSAPSSTVEHRHPPLAAFENYVKGLLAGTPETEVAYLEKALVLAPTFHRARVALSRAHADAESWEQARKEALVVPRSAPVWRRAQFVAAYAEIHLERYDEAFKRLKALDADGAAPEIYNNLGVIQLRRETTPQTGRPTYYFQKAADADKTRADYFFNLGYAYWRERDRQAAIYWLREALRRTPADAQAHYVLAAALEATGSATEASRERELARQLSSEFEEWEASAPSGTSGAAAPVPDDLERLRPYLEPPGARRSDEALVATERREHREVAAFHLERGRRLFERENDREAVAELRRVIFLSPYEAEAHLLLARIDLRAGRLREAEDALKIALWSEETAEARVVLGQVYLRQKNWDGARREAERALELDPSNPDAESLLKEIAASSAASSPPSPADSPQR